MRGSYEPGSGAWNKTPASQGPLSPMMSVNRLPRLNSSKSASMSPPRANTLILVSSIGDMPFARAAQMMEHDVLTLGPVVAEQGEDDVGDE
jgi:hypothetical protein